MKQESGNVSTGSADSAGDAVLSNPSAARGTGLDYEALSQAINCSLSRALLVLETQAALLARRGHSSHSLYQAALAQSPAGHRALVEQHLKEELEDFQRQVEAKTAELLGEQPDYGLTALEKEPEKQRMRVMKRLGSKSPPLKALT